MQQSARYVMSITSMGHWGRGEKEWARERLSQHTSWPLTFKAWNGERLQMKILLSLLKFSTLFYNVVEPEEDYLLCHEAVWYGLSIPMFLRQILHPHSGTKSKPNMRQAELSNSCLLCVFFTCSSSLKVETFHSAETPVHFYQLHGTTSQKTGLFKFVMAKRSIQHRRIGFIFSDTSLCWHSKQQISVGGGGRMTGRLCPRQGHKAQWTARADCGRCLKLHSGVQFSGNGITRLREMSLVPIF
jgi:hypothetical protein